MGKGGDKKQSVQHVRADKFQKSLMGFHCFLFRRSLREMFLCIFCLNGFLQTTKNNFVKTFPFYHLQIFKHFIFQRQKVFCAQLCYLVTFFLEPFSYFTADRGMTLLLMLATSGEILLMSTKPTKVFYFLSCQSQQQQKQMASKNVKMEWTNLSTALVTQLKRINDKEI